jgi:alkylation response protein AidB-like acyl-CoA dehydrogenase
VREGEHYVLTGRKRFISGSPFADFAVLMASTAPEGSAEREISAFFVDLAAPGVEVVSGYKTMAGQSHTGDIHLNAVRVPVAQLIGEPAAAWALRWGALPSTACCTAPPCWAWLSARCATRATMR